MQRWIMHVDMDAFFASVEQLDNPSYRGLPLIVGGQSLRGVVSTCSYEARKFGIHSAMSMVEAHRRCPQGIFIPGRMKRYQEVSQIIMGIFREFSPCVEQLSIDEAFLDISGMEHLVGEVTTLGTKIKVSIKERTGLTASAGLAPNKFLAKLASDLQKPDGLVIIHAEEARSFIAPLPVRKIFGIGQQAGSALAKMGIQTIGQLAAADLVLLQNALGNNARKIQLLAQGIDDRPVNSEHEAKSIGKETTFGEDLHRFADVRQELLKLVEQVGWRVRNSGLSGHTVTLKVKYASFKIVTRSQTMELAVSLDEEIFSIIMNLAQNVNWSLGGVRLLGVTLSKLVPNETAPLLEFEAETKRRKCNAALDALKNKFGENIIKRGRT